MLFGASVPARPADTGGVKLTLKIKTTLLVATVLVGVLALAGYAQNRQLSSDFRAVLQQQQDGLADTVADDLADKLETQLTVLAQSAGTFDAAFMADPAAQQRFVARLSGARPLFDRLLVVTRAGLVVANDPPPPNEAKINVADREYFQRMLRTGEPVVSSPVQSRGGSGAVVLMVAPLRDANGAIIGALMGSLLLQRPNMFGQLARSTVGRSGHFEVVTLGPKPVYVVHPDAAKLLAPVGERGPDTPAHEPDVVSRQPIRGTDWELRVVLPGAEAAAPIRQSRERLVLHLVALAALSPVLVWLGMVWLLRPLSTLHASIRRIREAPGSAAGAGIDITSQDERGDLAREFSALMGELQARQAELAAVTEASPLGFFRTDANGLITYANEAYLGLHGLARDEIAQGWLLLLRPEIRDVIWTSWLALIKGTKGVESTRRFVRRDGTVVLLMMRTAPRIVDGRVEGHVGTISDITDQASAEKAMRDLTKVFDSTTDFVVQSDWRGNIGYMNPAMRRALGMARDAPLNGMNFSELGTPEMNESVRSVITPEVKKRGVWVGESTIKLAGERVVPISHMVIAHLDKAGRIDHYSAIMRDISGEVLAKEALQRQTATLRSVTEAIPAVVSVVGADRRYRFVNSAFERWHGARREHVIGAPMSSVLGTLEYERTRPWVDRVLGGEAVSFDKSVLVNGAPAHLSISFIPLRVAGDLVDGFVSVAQDITQHKHEEERLLDLTHKDALTGLLNRAGFEDHLVRRLSEGGGPSLALLYIDLDHFKPVNDAHGHAVGDHLLQAFAQRLRSLVRPTDAVARLGGDEFAVLLAGVRDPSNAEAVAAKVIEAAAAPFDCDGITLHIGASAGVAFGVEFGSDWRDLVARADAMLYRAKQAGRGQHVVGAR